MAIHIYADPDEAELLDAAVQPSGAGGESAESGARTISASSAAGGLRPGVASKAFLDIHYHGKGGADAITPGRTTGGLAGGAGTKAFLDIHYHGKGGADVLTNPAGGGLAAGAGSKAFLDIHYHGKGGANVLTPGRESSGEGEGEEAPPALNVHYHEE